MRIRGVLSAARNAILLLLLMPLLALLLLVGCASAAGAATPSAYFADGVGAVSQYDIGSTGGLAAEAPTTASASPNPTGIAISPDGHSVYVTNSLSGRRDRSRRWPETMLSVDAAALKAKAWLQSDLRGPGPPLANVLHASPNGRSRLNRGSWIEPGER